jgi:hypothetical protein
MSDVIQMPDGYGGHIGDRYRMVARPGSHVVYARGPELVVEWYDFGDHAPYESANLLIFDRPAQHTLMALTDAPSNSTPHDFASRLAARFESYFDVKAFAEANGIPFATEVDFNP